MQMQNLRKASQILQHGLSALHFIMAAVLKKQPTSWHFWDSQQHREIQMAVMAHV